MDTKKFAAKAVEKAKEEVVEEIVEVAEKAVEVLETKVIKPLKGRLQEDRNHRSRRG